jgi:hypothetical protein
MTWGPPTGGSSSPTTRGRAEPGPGGGKAWSLWRMRSLGLRVPPAFVVTTRRVPTCGRRTARGLVEELRRGSALEAAWATPSAAASGRCWSRYGPARRSACPG